MLKLPAAGMAAIVSLTLFAGPASAKKPDPSTFSYVATGTVTLVKLRGSQRD